MTVTWLYNGSEFFSPADDKSFPEDFHEIFEYGMLSSQTNPFDPMEKAILKMSELHLNETDRIHTDWEMLNLKRSLQRDQSCEKHYWLILQKHTSSKIK